MKFNEMGLDSALLESIEKMGFEEATPIQSQTIPLALSGVDVIGQAQTGTGKTAAFGLPMLQKIDVSKKAVQGLVIAPTRELAIQTQEELFRLGQQKKIRISVVYGGADINRQIRQLKDKPHIVVGTPGRLLDHISRKTLRLNQVETLVLDEADEMLNMGFLEDIENIIQQVPDVRQTLLFSATMPQDIKRIGVQFMKHPEHVKIKSNEMTATLIAQYFVKCKDYEKFDIMTRLFDVQTPELTIVFGRTKRRVDELARGLEMRGFKAEGIHGDLSQQKRLSVLKDFKNNRLDVLVATDVAARGLDISGVTHVYNYDIPQDPESYVHRIGRTGRAGQEGMSVTFVTPNEMDYLRVIEDLTKKRMTPLKPPTALEALKGQMGNAIEQIQLLVKDEKAKSFAPAIRHLVDEYEADELATALLKLLVKDATEIPVKITPERPLPMRKKMVSKDRKGKGFHKEGHFNNGKRRERKRDSHSHNHSRKEQGKRGRKASFTIRHKD